MLALEFGDQILGALVQENNLCVCDGGILGTVALLSSISSR